MNKSPHPGQWIPADSKDSNRGLRYNQNKPKLSYCNFGLSVTIGEARVWERGAEKYAPGNWTKGMPILECIDSLQRHIDAFQNGENLDPESGLPHVDHIVCCAKILSNSFHERPDFDDRPSTNKGTVDGEDYLPREPMS